MRAGLIVALMAGCGGEPEPPPPTTLQDMEFLAYVDADQDGLSFNDAPRTIRLSDYFAVNRPGTKIIMISAAAGWCSPCMVEAGAMKDFAPEYEARGVAVLTAVFQDSSGSAATSDFARLWAESFMLPIPVLVDSSFATDAYFDVGAMPVNLFADASTQQILEIVTGAETGPDPLVEIRELLDFYLK